MHISHLLLTFRRPCEPGGETINDSLALLECSHVEILVFLGEPRVEFLTAGHFSLDLWEEGVAGRVGLRHFLLGR